MATRHLGALVTWKDQTAANDSK